MYIYMYIYHTHNFFTIANVFLLSFSEAFTLKNCLNRKLFVILTHTSIYLNRPIKHPGAQ